MMTPAAAWSSVKTQLKAELSPSFYQRFIENTDSRFADNTLTLICEDEEICQGLQSPQISRKISRLFSACVGEDVVFDYEITPQEDTQSPDLSLPTNLSEISIESATLSEYESRVKSHQVIVVPGYFRNFIPLMDPEIAWLYIAFRQMAYLSGSKIKGGRSFLYPASESHLLLACHTVLSNADLQIRRHGKNCNGWLPRRKAWGKHRGKQIKKAGLIAQPTLTMSAWICR